MATRRVIVDTSIASRLAALGLRSYEDFVRPCVGEVVHRTGTTETRSIESAGAGAPERLFLKIYRYARRAGRLPFRRDKCRIEARNYRLLRERCGIPVPEVLAYGRRSVRFRLVDSFIVTRGIPAAVPLDALARRLRGPGRERDRAGTVRRHLLEETARLVARMHAAGFYHIDLQWRNILVSDDGSDHPPVFLIDSARGAMRRWRVYREHGRLRDLSSLHKESTNWLSAREEIRWLRRYLGVEKLGVEHRALIRAIHHDRRTKDGESA